MSSGRRSSKRDAKPMVSTKDILDAARRRDPDQGEFLQAVEEVVSTLKPVFDKHPKYAHVMLRLIEPDRAIQFAVPWVDDKGVTQINRGWRVQFNSALGPYKGGLRFHPSVTLSVVKFLGFEQVFKNSLTTLPLGGGKGGSDFDPKGKSDAEVMRFCQSFMTELHRYIGPNRDVPAGDIGVGGREIGFLFGQYRRMRAGAFEGVLTGKGFAWGGSAVRPEATGYGLVYWCAELLKHHGQSIKGKRVVVSGAGNVAQYTVEKLLDLGAVPLTMGDSGGYVYEAGGLTREHLKEIQHLKNVKRGRIVDFAKKHKSVKFVAGQTPWEVKCDVALPCAHQNEIDGADAEKLVANGCKVVCEGANMPSTPSAIHVYFKHNVLYGPAKACNAGGVAVSGLEMAQNSERMHWTREEVDEKLKGIMKNIFDACVNAAKDYGMPDNYMAGANIAGFVKVADAMLDQGVV